MKGWFCALVCLLVFVSAPLVAQQKQEVPPFLKTRPAPSTVELNGQTFRLPDYSLRLRESGGNELLTRLPFGFLGLRETSRGVAFTLRPYRNPFNAAEIYRTMPNPLLVTQGLGRTADGPVFDFSKSAPHLAFFCRLEINEAANSVIPMTFRLGGMRYWQDDLRRRD